MKQTVDFYAFERAFKDYNRSGNFTYSGLRALFDYLEDLETDIGEEVELDVIAICCDFTEYSSAADAAEELSSWIPDEVDDEDDNETSALEYLRDMTTIIEFDDGIIVQSF